MIPLIQPLIDEKNKISQDQPWLILLKLTNVAGDLVLRLVRNTENITYKGEDYIAFPFEVDTIPEATQGSIASFNINVSNVDRQIQNYIEQDATFGSGWEIIMSVIHTSDLNPSAPVGEVAEIEQVWKSLSITADNETLAISVGMPNPMNIQVPSQKFSGGFCQRTFDDGVGCPYSTQTPVPSSLYNLENASLNTNSFVYRDGTTVNTSASSFNASMDYLPSSYLGLSKASDDIWITEGDIQTKVQTNQFFQIQYSRPIVLFSLTFEFLEVVRSIDTTGGLIATPKRFKVQGSNDGTSWTLLKQIDSSNPNDVTFTTDIQQPFTYFRFLFDEVIYHNYSGYESNISHYLQGGTYENNYKTQYEYIPYQYENNLGEWLPLKYLFNPVPNVWTDSKTSYPPLGQADQQSTAYSLSGKTRRVTIGQTYVPPLPDSNNIGAFGLQILDLVGTQEVGTYTSCNKTLANCQARFSTERTNSRGEKIGLPYLAFNGMEVRAIYES